MNEVAKEKKDNADEVVESLGELFLDAEVSSQEISGQGGSVGVSLYDENGDEKNNVKYLRVPEKGSVEAYKLPNGDWAVTRRDKLDHNKMDKLGGET